MTPKGLTIGASPGGSDKRSAARSTRRVTSKRPRQGLRAQRHGFRFPAHETKVKDFYDEDEIRRVYYPEMVELIKAESGAKRVVVFDHTAPRQTTSYAKRKKSGSRAPRAQ